MDKGSWIDIDKQKPEHGQKVLVSAGDIVAAVIADLNMYPGVIFWASYGISRVDWELDFQEDRWFPDLRDGVVTHWMPLPNPAVPSNTQAPNCPSCGKTMTLRIARKGPNAGSQFWGCSAFPDCKGTRPLGS